MITPYLEGEISRRSKKTGFRIFMALAIFGIAGMYYLEGERQTAQCVERKFTAITSKRRRSEGLRNLNPAEIANLRGTCRWEFYLRSIGR